MQTESRSPGQPQTAEACVCKGWVASPTALFVAEGLQGIEMGREMFIFLVLFIYLYKYIFVCL